MKSKENIGRSLLKLRAERSRNEVASAIGISISALQMYENGQRIPRDEIKYALAKFYHKSIEEIFYS